MVNTELTHSSALTGPHRLREPIARNELLILELLASEVL